MSTDKFDAVRKLMDDALDAHYQRLMENYAAFLRLTPEEQRAAELRHLQALATMKPEPFTVPLSTNPWWRSKP